MLVPAAAAGRLADHVRKPTRGPLSRRELDVLRLIAAGASNYEVATQLFISETTVKTHIYA
ncbi:LuxR C-terminal-related transcriptional regulator [Nonomuraea endophytica]|nr:LuxR C-terminal-related transcriptional regulator [Nonomuraea endophytica]